MAAIKDLLRQISDSALRERLTTEVDRMVKNKKFGLVFEEHIPECTPLYGVPFRRGSTVARKTGKMNDTYTVKTIRGDEIDCENKVMLERTTFQRAELVSVAQFGEPIFPSLEPIDKVENAPGDRLWHTIIEADNYHALQLLEYLYEGKVDCIYIDPPYNTGAKDWKYNNDYVDSADAWRHSKWLSMMKKRLSIAKCILAKDGVLITTIDDNEYAHLCFGCQKPRPTETDSSMHKNSCLSVVIRGNNSAFRQALLLKQAFDTRNSYSSKAERTAKNCMDRWSF